MSHHSFFQMNSSVSTDLKKFSLTLLDTKYTLESSSASISCKSFQLPGIRTSGVSSNFLPCSPGTQPPWCLTPPHLGFLNSLLGFEPCPAGLLQDVSQQAADHHGAEENHRTSKITSWKPSKKGVEKKKSGKKKKQMFKV